MIEAGVLDSPTVDAIITPHIWHDISIGTICIPAGPVMAGSDLFQLDVHGVAGHGAWPHLAVDPLPVAAEILLALQKIISREVDPLSRACLTVGQMHYGTAANIISETVTMHGTVRTSDPQLRDYIETRLRDIVDGIARAGRCRYTLDYQRIMPPLHNDTRLTDQAVAALLAHSFDAPNVQTAFDAGMGCEEFSVYLEHVPGIFLFIGSTEAGQPLTELHKPDFLFPESCIPIGVQALYDIAYDYLTSPQPQEV